MPHDSVSVGSLTSQLEKFIGERVTVDGYFVLGAGDGYLVASREARDLLEHSVLLVLGDRKKKVLATVPPYGGGQYYYCHAALVTGTVAECKGGPYACALVDIVEIAAEVSGEKFVVLFTKPPVA